MKESELRKHSTCSLCGNLIGATGIPAFWRVQLERFVLDVPAIKRQDGLASLLGSPMIAHVMGADEDLAKPLMDPITLTVCESCAMESRLPIAAMAETPEPKEG